ncbi:holo-ACP synthase [Estrella lausannensis]|uniref:Holo-[acyl-carrier-protein] synthase n=1 Tax=Estrella lausannensis TaxID=483423 RepID=A0A0H5DS60_9BACT|nr:holo-ACP synthase [Estrella lausannensis]CRX39517.1 Holo-[acyl-carrier-protein] synthase [Estrella lausannensis]
MTLALGTDIIEIQRIRESIERRGEPFLRRILTPSEYDYCMRFNPPYARIAGRFAGKEAIAKALGTGIGEEVSWLDIEILNEASGKPTVILSEKAQGLVDSITRNGHILISISHCKEFATATALLQTRS